MRGARQSRLLLVGAIDGSWLWDASAILGSEPATLFPEPKIAWVP